MSDPYRLLVTALVVAAVMGVAVVWHWLNQPPDDIGKFNRRYGWVMKLFGFIVWLGCPLFVAWLVWWLLV